MKKNFTCIECPKGCQLTVRVENEIVREVLGNQCPKGEVYAKQEIEHPLRTLTTTVAAQQLTVAMIPVRTTGPIPKPALREAMQLIKQIVITQPVKANQVLRKKFHVFQCRSHRHAYH